MRSPCTTAMRTSTLEGLDRAWEGAAPGGTESLAWVPGVVSGRFFETWDFYTTLLGFRTLAESNTYVHLRHPSGAQLAVLREETEGAPAELISATRGRGFWLFLEVEDAATAHQGLLEGGVVAAVPLRDTAWGDRQLAAHRVGRFSAESWSLPQVDRHEMVSAGTAIASANVSVGHC